MLLPPPGKASPQSTDGSGGRDRPGSSALSLSFQPAPHAIRQQFLTPVDQGIDRLGCAGQAAGDLPAVEPEPIAPFDHLPEVPSHGPQALTKGVPMTGCVDMMGAALVGGQN